MKVFKYLLFFSLFLSPLVEAEVFIELSPAQVNIDTPSAKTRPFVADFRLGYTRFNQQFELAFMTNIKDDNENQLSVEVPSVFSFFYHYLPNPNTSLKYHFIIGASYIEVDSSYPQVLSTSDNFYGVSYGIGFEESFKSAPHIKMSFDWIQLYRGEELNINATSLGIHYEF